MIETIAVLLAFIYVATWWAAYKRGYENGLRMGEAIGYHLRGRQDKLASEIRVEMKADDLYNLPPEQSPR